MMPCVIPLFGAVKYERSVKATPYLVSQGLLLLCEVAFAGWLVWEIGVVSEEIPLYFWVIIWPLIGNFALQVAFYIVVLQLWFFLRDKEQRKRNLNRRNFQEWEETDATEGVKSLL